jgi:hypothetical protein
MWGTAVMRIRKALLRTTMLAGIVGATYLSARDVRAGESMFAPNYAAVDGINGKVEALGGSLANRSIYGSKGALSIPLGGSWGAQIDGALGSFDGRGFGAIAGHWFWRNPGQALLGAYVGHTHWNEFGGVHVTQVAAEGEYYWQRWTLQGIVGVEFGNSATTTTTSVTPQSGINGITPGVITTFTEGYDVGTRFFDQINLKYYFTDNWDGYIGHRYLGGKNALALGSEYALPLSRGVMGSAFVEGRVGEGEFHGIWGGLKFYFGQKDKPLIARHRQDDPPIWAVDSLFSIINSHFENGSSSQFCDPSNYRLENINGSNECTFINPG